ncbi:FeoA family protein [Intestinibacillus massiliensis]|uniref:FeoA family protein n=1 Tax=Intestinibacillus massiliensis TaxID=1871029 RepID=UPI0038B2BC47
MPLSMVKTGMPGTIYKINGRDHTRRFLEGLGFVEGERVTVVSELGGNLILQVKDARVALDRSMANRIWVEDAVG